MKLIQLLDLQSELYGLDDRGHVWRAVFVREVDPPKAYTNEGADIECWRDMGPAVLPEPFPPLNVKLAPVTSESEPDTDPDAAPPTERPQDSEAKEYTKAREQLAGHDAADISSEAAIEAEAARVAAALGGEVQPAPVVAPVAVEPPVMAAHQRPCTTCGRPTSHWSIKCDACLRR